MNKEEALELIDELGGDEQAWVDLKSDYYIKGNPISKQNLSKMSSRWPIF